MTTTEPRTSPRHGGGATLTRNVAPGIHRLEHAYVNCYLVEEDVGLTLIDTALPATWPLLVKAIDAIGRTPSDVRAVLLTHAHFDHLGVARRAQSEWGVPVWAHAREEFIAQHPYRYKRESTPVIYPFRHPSAIPILGSMARAGAFSVKGVTGLAYFEAGDRLDVPGHPTVIFSPGHTWGHSAFHFADRSVLVSGDALVTLDPYTAHHGPQIIAGAATADSALALASLHALADTEATIVLPGHGQPFRTGIRAAVAEALAHGRS